MSAILFRSRGDQFYHYVEVNFTFGLLDCDHCIGDTIIPWMVKQGFCSIHYTVTLARNIVLSKIVISGFH